MVLDKRNTIREFSAFTGRTPEESTKILNQVMEFVAMVIKKHYTINLQKFAVLGVKIRRGGKKGINPSTGEPFLSEDKWVPYFRFSHFIEETIRYDKIDEESL